MSPQKVIVFGIGKLAEYVCYVLKHDSCYHVSALSIHKQYMPDVEMLWGLNIFDFEHLHEHCRPDEYRLFIAVGNNSVREKVYSQAKEYGYSFVSYISSKSTVWNDLIYGDNVLVSEGTVIGPFVEIGNGSFLLGPKVAHHCRIGNHTLLSACYLGGDSKIGDISFLGMNSTINQNIVVGRANVIGVGSNICSDTNDFEVFTNRGTVKRSLTSKDLKNLYLS